MVRGTAASLQNLTPRSPARAAGSGFGLPEAAPGSQHSSPTEMLVQWEQEEESLWESWLWAPAGDCQWCLISRHAPFLGFWGHICVCSLEGTQVLPGKCCMSCFLWFGLTCSCPDFMDLLHWEVSEQSSVTFCSEMSIKKIDQEKEKKKKMQRDGNGALSNTPVYLTGHSNKVIISWK